MYAVLYTAILAITAWAAFSTSTSEHVHADAHAHADQAALVFPAHEAHQAAHEEHACSTVCTLP